MTALWEVGSQNRKNRTSAALSFPLLVVPQLMKGNILSSSNLTIVDKFLATAQDFDILQVYDCEQCTGVR